MVTTASAPDLVNARQKYSEVTLALNAVNAKLDITQKDTAAAEVSLSDAGVRYDRACKDIAAGKSASPDSILAEQSTLHHKLRGLEQLKAELVAESQPLAEQLQALNKIVIELQEAEDDERLAADHQNTFRALEAAQRQLAEAQKVFNDSKFRLTEFRARVNNRKSRERQDQLRNGRPVAA